MNLREFAVYKTQLFEFWNWNSNVLLTYLFMVFLFSPMLSMGVLFIIAILQ